MACNVESHTWCEATNAEALADLVANEGVTAGTLPDDVVQALREATVAVLEEGAAADPSVRKVHDAFMAFKAQHDQWSGVSERPYHSFAG
jgi:TRAP-type mannitol/chloroaromatic compound transport system substrate-binding protein